MIAGHCLGPRPVGSVGYFDPDSATAGVSAQVDPAGMVSIKDAVRDDLGDQQAKHADLRLAEHLIERFHGAAGTGRRTDITSKRFVYRVTLLDGRVRLTPQVGRRHLALRGTPG